MIDLISEDFRFHQQALGLRDHRQSVLASNIANADTPGYKARDLDFASALAEAGGRPGGVVSRGTRLATTSPRHIPGAAASVLDQQLRFRQPVQPRLDGNTVDMDVERVQFADNAMRYQFELTVLSGRIQTLLSAIQQ